MLHTVVRSLLRESPDTRQQMLAQLPGFQRDMVDGILDIVLRVDDLDNRRRIVGDMIQKFQDEGIRFDYDLFIQSCGC